MLDFGNTSKVILMNTILRLKILFGLDGTDPAGTEYRKILSIRIARLVKEKDRKVQNILDHSIQNGRIGPLGGLAVHPNLSSVRSITFARAAGLRPRGSGVMSLQVSCSSCLTNSRDAAGHPVARFCRIQAIS